MRLVLTFLALAAFAPDALAQRYASFGLSDALYSADHVSAAHAASFVPTDEPLAFHLNPALLAGIGRSGRITAAGHLSTTYASGAIPGTDHAGIAGGTEVRFAGAPLALGVGLSRTSLDFGVNAQTFPDDPDTIGNERRSFETAWSAALGAGWRGPIDVDAGVGFHRRRGELDGSVNQGVTADLGALVTVPVLGRVARGSLSPVLDLSVGYAQRDIGLTHTLDDARGVTRDVTTLREGALGYSARAGLDVMIGTGYVRAVGLDGRVEGDATLVEELLVGAVSLERVLFGAGGSGVTGRRALRLSLFDVISYTRGRSDDGDFNVRSAWGISVDAGAALRLIGLLSDDLRLSETGDRLTLRASYADDSINGFDFEFAGLTVGWKP